MSENLELQDRILALAEEKFQKYGFGKVTMEEIAADLGISKKTLYKHFSNKEHILREVIKKIKVDFETFFDELFNNESLDFFEKLKRLMEYVTKNSARFEGNMIKDLVHNHPGIWAELKEYRKEQARSRIVRILDEGTKSGFFRNDILSELVAVLISSVHNIITPEVIKELPITEKNAHIYFSRIIFEGILTDEGRKKLKELDLPQK
ncbi:transcriptional regulator, TetR family [Melioribacter roseus P3M-2]|uniref:Transcriptional regulator, TetR family n=1 Tax=Melioribacter roseus (strain DSM 23840 / JCM 17771 / VKM B-2668 / P3M-2) TaxID=1191523 RepID=I6YVB6_MELRP|nr:TetR/AcrR family transcriptional regulator [Melioribacter roseus]AFN74487.1 transcriptional regulator, TetR family [Melioribacter roseus P3M-2]